MYVLSGKSKPQVLGPAIPVETPIRVTQHVLGKKNPSLFKRKTTTKSKTEHQQHTWGLSLPRRRDRLREASCVLALWAHRPISVRLERQHSKRVSHRSVPSCFLTCNEQGCALKGCLLYAFPQPKSCLSRAGYQMSGKTPFLVYSAQGQQQTQSVVEF